MFTEIIMDCTRRSVVGHLYTVFFRHMELDLTRFMRLQDHIMSSKELAQGLNNLIKNQNHRQNFKRKCHSLICYMTHQSSVYITSCFLCA